MTGVSGMLQPGILNAEELALSGMRETILQRVQELAIAHANGEDCSEIISDLLELGAKYDTQVKEILYKISYTPRYPVKMRYPVKKWKPL